MFVCQDAHVVPAKANSVESKNEEAWKRVGQAIINRRAELSVSQKKAGKDSRVGETIWNRLENGRQISYFRGTTVKVEKYLGWRIGSIENLLTSGEEPELETDMSRRIENPERELQVIREQSADLAARLDAVEDQLRQLLAWSKGPRSD